MGLYDNHHVFKIILDKEYFAERLYFYTSGCPFLVSKLWFNFRRVNGEVGTVKETTLNLGKKGKRIVEVYC